MTLAEALEHSSSGSSYVAIGELEGGEVGATEVIDRTGRRAVAKWKWPVNSADREALVRAAEIVESLRGRGATLPGYIAIEGIEAGLLVLQEFVGGRASDDVPDSVLDALVVLNELQAGAVPDGSGFSAYIMRSLRSGLDGYCEHRSLAHHSRATRRLHRTVQRVGEALEGATIEERDAVHLDFHHRNALTEGGRLVSVVDCEGYRSGDRFFDLVTLAFGLHVAQRSDRAERDLWDRIRKARPPEIVRAYVAHQAIRQVDWSIRFRDAEQVRSWLGRSEQLLADLPF